MLGPRRFNDISKVTLEALYRLRDAEELQRLKKELEDKDEEIIDLLSKLNRLEGKATLSSPDKPSYDDMQLDLAKAKRLVAARELRLKNLAGRLDKLQKEEEEDLPDIPGQLKETERDPIKQSQV